MKNKLLFIFAFSPFIVLHAQSQRDSIAVYAKVMDSFTHEMLKGVKVEVLRPDSSLVSQHNTDKNYSYGRSSYNFGDEFRGLFLLRADYIFRFSKEGYVTQYANLYKRDLGRREQRRSVGEIMMKKVGKHRDIELGAAEVRTSKIRMVVKGDTLIYNADAFQLAEGSMLDGLIKLLPGFQLRDGQITVNGQYVSSLLVNGEDFFRGDPRVALENLPAYMVNKVKVYRKEHPWSYITKGKEERKEDLPLVVDVNLKREYAIGWVGNVGAATARPIAISHASLDSVSQTTRGWLSMPMPTTPTTRANRALQATGMPTVRPPDAPRCRQPASSSSSKAIRTNGNTWATPKFITKTHSIRALHPQKPFNPHCLIALSIVHVAKQRAVTSRCRQSKPMKEREMKDSSMSLEHCIINITAVTLCHKGQNFQPTRRMPLARPH